jgi:lipopolysaccharide assembly outer membrane protein LptD (OstA)
MKLSVSLTSLWLFLAGLVTLSVCLAEEPIENLRVNLEYYPTGELKQELFAKRAEVPPDGNIIAKGLVLKEYATNGTVKIQINTEDCTFNQSKQTATSTNKVVLTRGGMKVSGKGFDWKGDKKELKILKNARVELPAAIIKEEGALKHVKKRK